MIQLLDTNTVKPPISNHPKYKDLVIAYGRCSIIGIDKQDVSSKTNSRHIYLVEDNLLPAISKLLICISVAVPKINVNKSSSIRDHIMYQVLSGLMIICEIVNLVGRGSVTFVRKKSGKSHEISETSCFGNHA